MIVSASGGVPPYIGTETYTNVLAGSHSYTVTDAEGQLDTVVFNLNQPSKLLLSLSAGLITSATRPTTITAMAAGGTSPYSYSLNGGAYQLSGTFSNIYAGTYTITTKDANSCTTSQMIVTILTETTPKLDKQLAIRVYPNPSSSYFTLIPIKYRGLPVSINIKVINQYGLIVYAASGLTNVSYELGIDFEPGHYTLVAEVERTIQAVQLIRL